jgi:ADP-ribosylglycohydrolase/fructose-1,6-bisphosphatase/inositol monophosphatase family enzyme
MVDYQQALSVAEAAAREAGALLRAEFHRPGGPRGAPGSCPADVEADELIRARLQRAFPDWSQRSEELAPMLRAEARSGGHLWLIDPNDGTHAFQRGHRGAAVSIALLRSTPSGGGEPVLGVVYAHTPPIGRDDLISWAEGGVLRRNGQPVEHRGAAPVERWRPEHTAFVSQSADRSALSSRANAELAAPGRSRAMPSIAYRLALVAAGGGHLATSLVDTVGHDYAAGHALLRAAGLELVDARGAPIRYDRDGRSSSHGGCFAGSRALLDSLVARDWRSVLAPGELDEDFVWPRADAIESDAGLLHRAQGCLLGQLAGDSLGSLVEFERASAIADRYPQQLRQLADGGTWDTIAGQPTDDSELALALARSMVRQGGYRADAVAAAYCDWLASKPFDCGMTIGAAFRAGVASRGRGGSIADACRVAANSQSQANGALMRLAPLGIAGVRVDPPALARYARDDASLSHPHPVCADANDLFATTLAHAIRSGDDAAAVHAFSCDYALGAELAAPIRDALQRSSEATPPECDARSQGWVLIALQNAFHQLLHADGPEAGVVASVMLGGDTDTNAAIAGALLGAVHGATAMPYPWTDRVLTCRPLAGLPGVLQPRPRRFWPVDALTLAERLLTIEGA